MNIAPGTKVLGISTGRSGCGILKLIGPAPYGGTLILGGHPDEDTATLVAARLISQRVGE